MMDDDIQDRLKEEQEHKLFLFQLDPSRKKNDPGKDFEKDKRHPNSALKKTEPAKKMLPKKFSLGNKMQQLESDTQNVRTKRRGFLILM
jgi:hypothetical protein